MHRELEESGLNRGVNGAVYLRGIAYELDEPRGIQQLEELRANPELLTTLKSLGLAHYCPSRQAPAEMAAAAAQRTLWKARVKPDEVEVLLYATSSWWNARFYGSDIDTLFSRLRLTRAFPIGVTLAECANVVAALRIAASLIASGRQRNVLVVTVDKTEDGKSRIVPPEVSVASDSAASILVSGDPGGTFELVATEQLNIPVTYEQHPQEDMVRYLKTTARGIQEVCARTLAAVGKTPADFAWLITNNFNTSVTKLFSSQSGFGADRTFTDNIARFGHSYGADELINLHDCLNAHPARAGDLFLLLASSPHLWATAVLRKL